MSDLSNFPVTEAAMRPASPERRCFYCHQPIGQPHKTDCVLVQKKVQIRMTVVYEVSAPSHWTKEDIESHRNDGSWCASNAIEELEKLFGDDQGCMCDAAQFEYVGHDTEPFLAE